jgi:hypothetical protein
MVQVSWDDRARHVPVTGRPIPKSRTVPVLLHTQRLGVVQRISLCLAVITPTVLARRSAAAPDVVVCLTGTEDGGSRAVFAGSVGGESRTPSSDKSALRIA